MISNKRIQGALLLLSLGGQCEGFAAVRGKRPRTVNVSYRQTDVDSYLDSLSSFETSAAGALQDFHQHLPLDLPSWLANKQGHMLEEKMEKLREVMLQSFFSEREIENLTSAIHQASEGDDNKAAGAIDLCLIMVETMEMGLNSLIAAAFHFCACFATRETLKANHSMNVWHHKPNELLASFGDHSAEIFKDASRLKQMEMVFSSIIHNPTTKATPDFKNASNLRKLLLTSTKDWRALAIRSAASLFRLRGLEANASQGLTREAGRAAREALYIFAPLASRLGMQRLKNELESAAFRILYRRQHNTLASISATRPQHGLTIGESMDRVLQNVKEEMEEMLKNDPDFSNAVERVEVSARVKEPYSLWRKMLRKGAKHILHVSDALALRIVLKAKKATPDEADEITSARERALCYYAQQLCTRRWVPLQDDPRYKDYIENPKPNGYQSLHYTASTEWEGEPWKLEIQIRSSEMHKVAEYGLASHWDYKETKKGTQQQEQEPKTIDYSSDAYAKQLREWHWQQRSGSIQWDASPASIESETDFLDGEARVRAERIRERTQRLAPYISALNEAQNDLARDNVFVFLSGEDQGGKILALPSGSFVIDALRDVGSYGNTATRNGFTANLYQKLENGDVISTAATEQPAMLALRHENNMILSDAMREYN